MKIIFKSILFMILFCFGASCSKSQSPDSPEQPPKTDPVVIPPPQSSTGKLIPVGIESAGHTILFNYVGNTNLLSSVTDSEGIKINFHYKENVLTGFTSDYSKQIYANDIWRDATKKIIRVSKYQDKGSITPGGEFKIDYNEQDQVVEVRYYSAKNTLLKTEKLSYNATAELTGLQVSEPNSITQQVLDYDQKNGMFKNSPLAMLLFLETDHELFTSINHNILSRSGSAGTVTYSYEYQTDNFPRQLTLLKNNQTTIFKITYKTY